MKELPHNPLPWESVPNGGGYYTIRRVGADKNMADVTDTCRDLVAILKADADLIVKAVNMHDELIETLESARNGIQWFIDDNCGGNEADYEMLKKIDELIAKAEKS